MASSSTADQVEEYVRNGFKVLAILGVEGSPTCGVGPDSGILIEELQSELKKRKIEVPMKSVSHKYASQGVAWLEKILTR